MKDIPVFTADNGIATLILSEIQYSGRAYVLVRSVWTDAAALLSECRGFCRACGAETVYASWETEPLPGDHAYDMVEMACQKAQLPPKRRELLLEDLNPDNGQAFLEIYNSCFRSIPGAATYGNRDLARLFGEETAYLAKVDGVYAAVAEISREGLEGIAVLPQFRGLGYDMALTVLERVPSLNLRLKVANTNERAVALYDRLGFRESRILSRWYVL